MPELPLSQWVETFRSEGPMLVVMLITSVVVVALALARLWVVISARLALRKAERSVLTSLRTGNWEEGRKRAEALAPPIREVFVAGLDRVTGKIKGDAAMAMGREQRRAMGRIRSTLWILGSTGALMPFVGLFGTVVGVMSAFQAMSQADAGGGVKVVSGGIAAALVATAAGLFVALEAIIFFNLLQNMSASIARDLGLLVDETLELALVRRSDAERAE